MRNRVKQAGNTLVPNDKASGVFGDGTTRKHFPLRHSHDAIRNRRIRDPSNVSDGTFAVPFDGNNYPKGDPNMTSRVDNIRPSSSRCGCKDYGLYQRSWPPGTTFSTCPAMIRLGWRGEGKRRLPDRVSSIRRPVQLRLY